MCLVINNVDVSDVKCLINHDFNYVIGRTQAETLTLKLDDKGLYFKCLLPNTSYARDIYENIKAGNVNRNKHLKYKPLSSNFNVNVSACVRPIT